MSTYVIKWLKDKLGTRFFPVTHINAVRDDTGTSLSSMLEAKQDTLVSGTNIKTVNNNSLVGSGNVSIATGDTNVIETVKVNGSALTPDANKAVNVTAVTSFNGSTGAVTYTAPVTSVNGETGAVTLSIPSEVTESTVSGWGFTKNAGTITGITMNGSSKGTSGVVNLGTVITAHQDISGKADKSTTTTAGTYKSVTVNSSGIVTGGSNPTTIAGYGITDAYTKSEVDDVVDDYLPLTGGTISTNSTSPLTIADIRSASELYVALLFKKGSTQLGYLGFLSQDTPVFVNHNGGTTQTLLHTGNFVAGTDYQTPIPANTYAPYNSNGYLPKNGGTMTGSITMGTNAIIFDKEVNTDWNVGTTNSGIRLFNSQSSIPTGAFSTYSTALSVYGAYGFQIASKSNGNNFAMRSAYGTNYASWVTLYHSGNSNKSDVNWSCNNLIAAGTVQQGSDARVKDAQKEISADDAIAVMEKLRPKTWTWNDKMSGNSGKKSAGLVAQEVKDIVPDAVTISEMCDIEDFHSLNYTVIQGYEIAAIKGLIQENAQLKREIAEIKEMLKRVL